MMSIYFVVQSQGGHGGGQEIPAKAIDGAKAMTIAANLMPSPGGRGSDMVGDIIGTLCRQYASTTKQDHTKTQTRISMPHYFAAVGRGERPDA